MQQPTEHQEQIAFMSWLARFNPLVYEMTYHIPNGRLSAIEGAKYKRLGAKSGVPDVCIAYPVEPYHGLYIEFKRRDGGSGVSENQELWLVRLNHVGYKAIVCKGWEEAKDVFESYLGGKL
jgi:hypothetical protein